VLTSLAAEHPPRKVDRDEVFLECTKSTCPVCKVVVDAQVHVRVHLRVAVDQRLEPAVFLAPLAAVPSPQKSCAGSIFQTGHSRPRGRNWAMRG